MQQDLKTEGHGCLLAGIAVSTEVRAVAAGSVGTAEAAESRYADSESRVFPNPEMKLDLERTALVVIDPRVDLLSLESAAWLAPSVGVIECKTAQNLARLFKASKHAGITVAISLTSEDPRSGFMPELARYFEDGRTIICSPHRLYSPLPRVNDVGLRLRGQRVAQIILAGMIAGVGIECHLRDFLEQGFEVALVRDAIAGPRLPEGNGYLSTLVNSRGIANELWTTEETVKRLGLSRTCFTATP